MSIDFSISVFLFKSIVKRQIFVFSLAPDVRLSVAGGNNKKEEKNETVLLDQVCRAPYVTLFDSTFDSASRACSPLAVCINRSAYMVTIRWIRTDC